MGSSVQPITPAIPAGQGGGQPDPQTQARISANVAKMRAANATPDEILHYISVIEGIPPTGAPHADVPHGTSREFGPEPVVSRGPVNDASRAVLRGMTFGFGDEALAAENALMSRLRGEGPFGPAYAANVAAERAATKEFSAAHPKTAAALTLAGGIPSALMLPGGAIIGGALAGGLTGAGEGEGGVMSRLPSAAVGAGAGAVGGALLAGGGKLGAVGARKLSGMLAADNPLQRLLQPVVSATGPKAEAAKLVGERHGQDVSAGVTPRTLPADFPGTALDVAGPNVRSLAEGVGTSPGRGSATLTKLFTERQASERPIVTQALEDATGVTTGSGMATARALREARAVEAERNFGAARAATAGQPIQIPGLDEIIRTPSGQIAYKSALVEKANRLSALPKGTVPAGAPPGFSSAQWASVLQRAAQRDIAIPSSEVDRPDAEVLHYMKQKLATLARLGQNDGAGGALSTSAQGNVGLWRSVQDALPEPWKEADRAYAAASETMALNKAGRNILRTSANPAGPNAEWRDLAGLTDRLKMAPPEAQQAFQQGAGQAVTSGYAATARSPGRFLFGTPERAQQTTLAAKTPAAADRLRALTDAYQSSKELQQQVLAGSRTAMRGAEAMARQPTIPPSIVGSWRPAHFLASRFATRGAQQSREATDAEIANLLTQAAPAGTDILSAIRARSTAQEAMKQRLAKALSLAPAQWGGQLGSTP